MRILTTFLRERGGEPTNKVENATSENLRQSESPGFSSAPSIHRSGQRTARTYDAPLPVLRARVVPAKTEDSPPRRHRVTAVQCR